MAKGMFGREMRKLRIMRGYRAKDLADAIGIDATTISRIERGEREPSKKRKQEIVGFFKQPPPLPCANYGNQAYTSQIRNLRLLKNYTLEEVSHMTGVPVWKLQRYETGKTAPSETQIQEIINFYSCLPQNKNIKIRKKRKHIIKEVDGNKLVSCVYGQNLLSSAFGREFCKLREYFNLYRSDIAALVDVSEQTLYAYEKGKIQPSTSAKQRLINALFIFRGMAPRYNVPGDRRIPRRNKLSGVFSKNNRFFCTVFFAKQQYYLGSFNSEQEAHDQHLRALNIINDNKSVEKTKKALEELKKQAVSPVRHRYLLTKSKYPGAFKTKNTWYASITINYKSYYLGSAPDEQAASKKYMKACEIAGSGKPTEEILAALEQLKKEEI